MNVANGLLSSHYHIVITAHRLMYCNSMATVLRPEDRELHKSTLVQAGLPVS